VEFIDTHSHLYDEAFNSEEDLAVARALEAGVIKMILPDIDASTRDSMFRLAGRHPDILYPTLGLHPTSVSANWKEEMDALENEFGKHKIWAVGEIGIDCYWSKDFLEQQKEVFRTQLEMASKADLPVIIHSRESTELIINILKDYKKFDLRGMFHAYSGSAETFRELQKLGDWYIGIGGVLTYKKASIAETVKDIPLERIILETDSPYLTPVPHRGKRNESSYIPHIAEKLASQKDISIETVAETTTQNAKRLFRL
jgi:TatD DNase family protein